MLLERSISALAQHGSQRCAGAPARVHASCIRPWPPRGCAPRYRWSSRTAEPLCRHVCARSAATENESVGSKDDDEVLLLRRSKGMIDEQDTPEGLTDVMSSNETSSSASMDEEEQPALLQQAPPQLLDDDGAQPSAAAKAALQPAPSQQQPAAADPLWSSSDDLVSLAYAISTGAIVATCVFLFDCSIQYIHDLPDILSLQFHLGGGRATGLQLFGYSVPFRCIMPIGAGFIVAWLQSWGFSPALKFLTRAIEGVVDDDKNAGFPKSYGQVLRKAAASAITLGSGASLGPEAPSVELGANLAAVMAPKHLNKRRQRMLVAAGAAAGVSAAFDAPISGALFAVEFVLKSSRLGLDRLSTSTVFVSTSVAAGVVGALRTEGQALGITGAATHLVGRIPYFSIQPNLLVDVLQFSALGLGCAGAAVALYEGVRVSETFLRPLPRWVSAPLGGALCGVIAFRYPQVQYGYIALEEIFRDSSRLGLGELSGLLAAKIVATSLCVGGGLVGGLFAPSLFIGALVGDVMGHFVADKWGLVDPTSLAVVGAAATLGAACRAPLTAVALMVEITRDTGLLVPLLAAIGVAAVVTEYLEGAFSRQLERALVQYYHKERALVAGVMTKLTPSPSSSSSSSSSASTSASNGSGGSASSKTVESVMSTKARLYVRHTLPLQQARAAMVAKQSEAAVVVDDNFTPMGLVFVEDIEVELVKQQLLLEPDNNFGRPS